MSASDLARSASPTTSETLSRTLAKFRDQKFLHVKGNTVVLMRPRELQKLLQRNFGEL
jgi:CRP-like cAMP-binding protein